LSKKISDKDKRDWENFLNRREKIPNKDETDKIEKKYQTVLIDLHGFTLEEANKKIEKFIKNAYENNIYKIIVVTGKGIHSQNEKNPYVSKDLSILKYSVPEFISNNKNLINLIIKIEEAKIEDGGSGAFYIYLKKIKK
tara:strand:- start:1056 stop:1472 length:417 start_codon:yes stop_codon:yes gene_type:complete